MLIPKPVPACRIQDRTGRSHTIRPLCLADLARFEEKLGGPLATHMHKASARDVLELLALGLAHEGLSQDEVGRLFDLPSFIHAFAPVAEAMEK